MYILCYAKDSILLMFSLCRSKVEAHGQGHPQSRLARNPVHALSSMKAAKCPHVLLLDMALSHAHTNSGDFVAASLSVSHS